MNKLAEKYDKMAFKTKPYRQFVVQLKDLPWIKYT